MIARPLRTLPFLLLACPAGAAEPLHVVFITVDDLRPELGAYGRDHIKSPNIDRLARAGVVFDRAYVQQAVCSPSRSSVMTGTRPDTTRVWDLVTHFRTALPDVVTIGQHFPKHGYFVQGMGKRRSRLEAGRARRVVQAQQLGERHERTTDRLGSRHEDGGCAHQRPRGDGGHLPDALGAGGPAAAASSRGHEFQAPAG